MDGRAGKESSCQIHRVQQRCRRELRVVEVDIMIEQLQAFRPECRCKRRRVSFSTRLKSGLCRWMAPHAHGLIFALNIEFEACLQPSFESDGDITPTFLKFLNSYLLTWYMTGPTGMSQSSRNMPKAVAVSTHNLFSYSSLSPKTINSPRHNFSKYASFSSQRKISSCNPRIR